MANIEHQQEVRIVLRQQLHQLSQLDHQPQSKRRKRKKDVHQALTIHSSANMSSPKTMLILLGLILISCRATTFADDRSQSAAGSEAAKLSSVLALSQPDKPEAAASTTNVILIKYANVTKDSTTGDNVLVADESQLQLSEFKLYEPLSVSVIESKFAHSIQLFDVSHNQLATLSKDLFCPMSNEIRQLNISHNLIENFDFLGLISQAGQICLSELRVLDMSHNRIKHLPATAVANLQNLEILNLANNLIESLDELSLSSLSKLTKLDLSANKIQQLPLRIFHKSSSMQVLRLQSNHLQTTISQVFLSGLISLEELNLSRNNISHVMDSAFLDKVNLTRVDLTHNQLTSFRQEALRVTSLKQATGYKHRLHHNGQYAGLTPKQVHSQSASAEFYLASNPFVCDCYLEWMRKFQPYAIKRPVLAAASSSSSVRQPNQRVSITDSMLADQAQLDHPLVRTSSRVYYQNDQPTVISSPSSDSSNNISEIISSHQTVDPTVGLHQTSSRPLVTNSGPSQQAAHLAHHYARVADLDLIKCNPLFRRNTQRNAHHHNTHHERLFRASGHSRAVAPPESGHHSQQQHHRQQDTMIDLLSADSSNFLCRYKSHCFALCHCCEFDACDCEMICPNGCNCYYDSTWQTNIIDCSSSNHTVVPDRIPMDVSGLYLDGNNIDSLKPSNLIARKSLKTLYLNSSNLQYIANRTFNGLIELQILYLHDNMLRSLNGYEFEPLAQLKALYLQSNRLDNINNQTFIYLRSLEVLDLSNNRLTSINLDLFWSIGHHNIRLRQLSIAHNWWSCQCSSINRFRQILKQKFLLNGSVNIADKNQLRCYYNSTTVGPLILADGSSMQQPLYASYPTTANRQQTLLTEINQCSEMIEDRQEVDVNPPLISAVTELPPNTLSNNEYPNDPFYNPDVNQPSPSNNPYNTQPPALDQSIYSQPGLIVQPSDTLPNQFGGTNGQRSTGLPLTSAIFLVLLFGGIVLIALSIVALIRQHRFHQSHHKKSSAASTTSASSSASSTAISSLNGKSQRHHHTLQHQAMSHQLIMSNGSSNATTTNINHHLQHLHQQQQSQHHHSASSQSNIYAALVSPTGANSTNVASVPNNNNNNTQMISNLYSNSSTTTSHHSSSMQSGHENNYPRHWQSSQHQSVYNQPYAGLGPVENHYAINVSSQASYKTGSLYNAPNNCLDTQQALEGSPQGDWLKMPKVKQFVSKLVNKSLALGGYRASSRDELSAISSDKIYDAFISYDKRDEAFVMQHLSAELEYGQPQYRIADRYRDLPLPSSAYIAEAITSVIGCSHRTIVVLTESYMASSWCRYELQAALQESSADKSHKIIAVILDPKCLLDMDAEMRSLLTNPSVSIYNQPQLQQLVQLDGDHHSHHHHHHPHQQQQQQQQQQLVATLTNMASGNQQVSTQTAQLASKIAFINYNERKFWPKIKQLMPMPRASTQTLTLTTKN